MVVKRTMDGRMDGRQTFLYPGSHRVFLNGGRRAEKQICQIKKCGGFLFTLIEKNNACSLRFRRYGGQSGGRQRCEGRKRTRPL